MRIANLWSGCTLILFGLVMHWLIIPAQIEEGPDGMMSPRLLPQMMVWLIVGLSLLLIATNLRSGDAASTLPQDKPMSRPISRDEVIAFGKIALVFAAALILFLTSGPLLAGIALITGSLVALGERRPLVIVLMPLGLIGATYLLFYRLLGTAIV